LRETYEISATFEPTFDNIRDNLQKKFPDNTNVDRMGNAFGKLLSGTFNNQIKMRIFMIGYFMTSIFLNTKLCNHVILFSGKKYRRYNLKLKTGIEQSVGPAESPNIETNEGQQELEKSPLYNMSNR